MSVKEDQDEFNNSGARGLLQRLMKTENEVFLKLNASGWIGEQVPEQPAPGSGPYIHWRRGDEAWHFRNESADDTHREVYRIFV